MRLHDVMHSERRLTLVFEYCDQVFTMNSTSFGLCMSLSLYIYILILLILPDWRLVFPGFIFKRPSHCKAICDIKLKRFKLFSAHSLVK